MNITQFSEPWPWYVAGPIIGLSVPVLLLLGNKRLGISSTLQDICALCLPGFSKKLKFDVAGNAWNLYFVIGVLIGGIICGQFLSSSNPVDISSSTHAYLTSIGITDFSGLAPIEIFNWSNVVSVEGFFYMVFGGFLVGFGTRYAGGCTSGHGIFGLATFNIGSLVAVIGFFIGGLTMLHLILPLIIN
jgi:uncharacterized membrane protein YedE/YeeE